MEILIVLIFLAFLFGGLYWYAGYSTRSGFAKDENQNFIPDAWEEKYSWFLRKRYHHASRCSNRFYISESDWIKQY